MIMIKKSGAFILFREMPRSVEHYFLSLFLLTSDLSMIWFNREWQSLQPERQGCPYILLLPKKEILVTYLQKAKPSQHFLTSLE